MDNKKIKYLLINFILWIILLILYFVFVFMVDGVLGIGFKDQWKRIKKWFIRNTNLKSRFLFDD